MSDSFYVPVGDGVWQATVHTAGPWSSSAQHGGPPSALLGRAMLRCQPRPDMMITRFTCEILRAIPVGEITVAARVARPGRSVELLEATASAGGREVARATAWRVLRTACPAVESRHPVPPPLPADPPGALADAGRGGGGLVGRLHVRHGVAAGAAASPFPARPPCGCGCGTRSCLTRSPRRSSACWSPPTAATAPRGSWTSAAGCSSTPSSPCTCTASQPASGSAWTPDRHHVRRRGLATCRLFDLDGPLGVSAQSLFIAPRS